MGTTKRSNQGVALKEKTCVCSLQQASVPSGANSFPLGTPPIRRAPVSIDSGGITFFRTIFPAYVALGCSEKCLEIYSRMCYYFR